jgi:hypothetical protein
MGRRAIVPDAYGDALGRRFDPNEQAGSRELANGPCPNCETVGLRDSSEVLVLIGGRYWDRTSGPCRVKRGYGAYESTICEASSQLQQALGIT